MKNIALIIVVLLIACGPDRFNPDFEQENVSGFKAVYVDSSEMSIQIGSPQPIVTAGKIYSYGDLLLVNEVGKGIHIYNNSNPKEPKQLYYVTIPGNHDMAVKNGILYADNYKDLVALKIEADTVLELKRIVDFIEFSTEHPSENNVYFDCVDPSLGVVVGWERTTLHKPQCYRP